MIYTQIKEKLEKQDKKLLSKTLGYNNQKNFEKTLEKFLSFTTLHRWFESGNYDFVNQPHEFFTKISMALKLDKKDINNTLEEEKVYIKEVERFKGSYIYVNTNFRRKNEPIFILAILEKNRYVSLYKDRNLLFKSTSQILEILSQRIQEHYEANKEGLVVWGRIVNYQVHLEEKAYIFGTDGVLQENLQPVFESQATLALK